MLIQEPEHLWLDQSTIQSRFPKVLRICQYKEGLVTEFGSSGDGQTSWNINLRRNHMDHEIPEINELFECLNQIKLDANEDYLTWSPGNGGKFSVSNCYKYCINRQLNNQLNRVQDCL